MYNKPDMIFSTKHHCLALLARKPGGHFLVFVIKQAWAALFGGLLLFGIVFTHYVDLPWLARYDWLFIWAVLIQLAMLAFRLEQPREVVTILLFHLVGLGMELFKTSTLMNSWAYPEDNLIRLVGVPLFSGFMYAAVGSYLARAWRVLAFRFTGYPRRVWTILLALAIYLNFFSHHVMADLRYVLLATVLLLFGRTVVHYRLITRAHRMPLVIGFGLVSSVIWLAENAATYTQVWLYPSQASEWHAVGIDKWGSWFLLMIVSFIMIDLLHAVRRRSPDIDVARTEG